MSEEECLEEQAMEAEALEAIYETQFQKHSPQEWSIELYPDVGDGSNHVGCSLKLSLPATYPHESLPTITIEIVKGLALEHAKLLEGIARDEAEANQGMPVCFAVAEKVKEWLQENNTKGLDDLSMHAQMMRKMQTPETKVMF
jgi:hypothetical protein